MNIRNIILLLFVLGIIACGNQDWSYPDYKYTSCYFPFQTPVRSLVLGKYDQGDNENDNNHKFEIGVTIGGVYDNNEERKVYFKVDQSLLQNVENVKALPSAYYEIKTQSPVSINPGTTKGRIEVQLNPAFFDDTLSFASFEEVNYVVPLLITSVENVDTLLSGKSVTTNPDRVNSDEWDTKPKDYTLYGIKFINEYHGNYLRRGKDVLTDDQNNKVENIYHEKYVVDDKVVMVSTSGKSKVLLEQMIRRGENASPGNLTMELTFNADKSCIVASTEDDPYSVVGTGTFVADGDEWGGEKRDVIYLDYSYTDAENNETHAVKDTLVIRDRAVVFESFDVEIAE